MPSTQPVREKEGGTERGSFTPSPHPLFLFDTYIFGGKGEIEKARTRESHHIFNWSGYMEHGFTHLLEKRGGYRMD